jgi:hypothetical protein
VAIGDLLSKCSERALFPRFSTFFCRQRKERGGPGGNRGLVWDEFVLGMHRAPLRIRGDARSMRAPAKHQAL